MKRIIFDSDSDMHIFQMAGCGSVEPEAEENQETDELEAVLKHFEKMAFQSVTKL